MCDGYCISILSWEKTSKKMIKVICSKQTKIQKNGSYHSISRHILVIKRIFDLVGYADPLSRILIDTIPYLKLSFVKIVDLLMKAVLCDSPYSLSQYMFDLLWTLTAHFHNIFLIMKIFCSACLQETFMLYKYSIRIYALMNDYKGKNKWK